MYLLKSLRMRTKNFLQVSLMATHLNSKQNLENCIQRSASTVTYELSPHDEQMEKSLDEPDSPLRWEIRKSIENGCPEVPEKIRFGTRSSSDNNMFYYVLRKKCRTITDREDRRDTVKEVLKSNIKWLGENLAYEYLRTYPEKSASVFHYDMSKPTFWLSALKCSRSEEFVELKEKLEEAGIEECNLSIAIAKVYAYLIDSYHLDSTSWRRSFGPDDVHDFLRNVNLSETDYKAIKILFSLEYFEENRI